jgi:hypothetical protein
MYLILTSKVGQFTTELAEGLREIEAYDYHFFGKRKARFVIAEMANEVKVKVIEDAPPHTVNYVPSKFFPRFDSLDKAREEIKQLANYGHLDTRLSRA